MFVISYLHEILRTAPPDRKLLVLDRLPKSRAHGHHWKNSDWGVYIIIMKTTIMGDLCTVLLLLLFCKGSYLPFASESQSSAGAICRNEGVDHAVYIVLSGRTEWDLRNSVTRHYMPEQNRRNLYSKDSSLRGGHVPMLTIIIVIYRGTHAAVSVGDIPNDLYPISSSQLLDSSQNLPKIAHLCLYSPAI